MMNEKNISLETYEEALTYIYSFKGFKTKINNSDKSQFYLNHLLDLRNKISKLKIIQITGTDGKGSTCAYIQALFNSSSINNIIFTSPHVNSIRERININGEIISKKKIIEYVKKISPFLEQYRETEYHIGPYQIMFVISVMIHSIEFENFWGVYEVSIGGFSDETNIFNNKIIGLTKISNDHLDKFGDRKSLIFEKIKLSTKGDILFSLSQNSKAKKIIESHCTNLKIHLNWVETKFSQNVPLNLLIPGVFQKSLYLLALSIIEFIKDKYSILANMQLLKKVELPGRCSKIKINNKSFLFSCAHSEQAVISSISSFCKRKGSKAIIFSVSEKRFSLKVMNKILSFTNFNLIIFTKISSYGGMEPKEILSAVNKLSSRTVSHFPNLLESTKFVLNQNIENILVLGSFRIIRDVDLTLIKLSLSPIFSPLNEIDPEPEWHNKIL